MSYPLLIEAMLKSDFYPHAVSEPIELLQTHISYVLLTGEFAYKLKKHLDLGFLNFLSLESRRFFCEEELRLNRRLSPDLYLEVLPVQEREGHFAFGLSVDSEVVDYALKMRQFPQENLFSRMFEAGRISADHLRQLAHLIADFHRKASSSDDVIACGSVDAIRRMMDDNYDATSKFIGRLQTQKQFNETANFTRRFLVKHRDWFEDRQRQKRIRECHGDLHLNNICMFHDRIQVFDCIEFSKQLRNIDVMYEIAFLAMDLDFRQRPDLANLFVNRYLELSGDYEGAVLLPFYCCMRATVRAKVDSFLSEEDTVDREQQQRAAERAKRYFHLAAQYAKPKSGQLTIMSGLSGSGKSTIAAQVASEEGAIVIRSDAVRKHLAGIDLHSSSVSEHQKGIYTDKMTQRVYSRLLQLGMRLAQNGVDVILDATYNKRSLRERVLRDALQAGIDPRIFYCMASLDELKKRIVERKSDVSDVTVEILEKQKEQFEPFSQFESNYVRTIQTGKF